MKKIILLFITSLIAGCISNKKLSSGIYTMEFNHEQPKQQQFKTDFLFDVRDNHVEIISPLSGDIFLYGIIQDNKFLLSQLSRDYDTSIVSYQGDLISDNNIEGIFEGKNFDKPGWNRRFREPKIEIFAGKFKIYPSQKTKTCRDLLNFLPVVKYGNPELKFDPRTILIIMDNNAHIYIPKEIIFSDIGVDFISSGLKKLTLKELVNEMKKTTSTYGTDIPVAIYIDSNLKYSSLTDLFKACAQTDLRKYKIMALPPKWEAPLAIPFAIQGKIDYPEKVNLNHQLNFGAGVYDLLIDNKVEGKYNITELDEKLQKFMNNGNVPFILLSPSPETPTVEVAKVMGLLLKNDIRICLKIEDYNKKDVLNPPPSGK